MGLGPTEQRVEGRRSVGDLDEVRFDQPRAFSEGGGAEPRWAVTAAEAREVGDRPADPTSEVGHAFRGARQGPNVGECELAHPGPGVQDPGVLEGVGHEPQAGGVAEAEVAAPFAVEAGCGVAAAGPGAVLDLVVAQLAEQPGTQELCPVGNPEGVSLGVPEVGAHTELAVPVEGGAAQDVSGIGHLLGLGLEAVG